MALEQAAPPSRNGQQQEVKDGRQQPIYQHSQHCSFILLAEFDIDKGSTLAHVYPDRQSIQGHDDHVLAELMLPDGAHLRSEDWTTFFLASSESVGSGSSAMQYQASDLINVISLVRTKHDASVRRGALVKAIAIGTRHPNLHTFKPLLLRGLDQYFKEPILSTLEDLFHAINSIDLSRMPLFSRSEKLVLRGSDRNDLLSERFLLARQSSTNVPPSPLSSKKDSRRSALSSSSSQKRRSPTTSQRDSTTSSEQDVRPESVTAQDGTVQDTHFWDTSVSYGSHDLPIRWPTDSWQEEIGEYSILHLIQTFGNQAVIGPLHAHLHSNGPLTHPITVLFNAIVTSKRIIFLGHNQPAGLVASHVLSAAALATGSGSLLPGMRRRLHPYANLISLDTLEQTPGYIAGVTNPRFEDLRCWDLLCNVETGRITIHKDVRAAAKIRLPGGSINGASRNAAAVSSLGLSAASTPGSSSIGPAQHGDTDVDNGSISEFGGLRSKASSISALTRARALSLANDSNSQFAGVPDARPEAPDNCFMEELQAAVYARCSERFARAKVYEYVTLFAKQVDRHEDFFHGRASSSVVQWPHQPYLNGQLGSGTAFGDPDGEAKELHANSGRVEGFRSSEMWREWRTDNFKSQSEANVDWWHQMSRLRGKGRPMHPSEAQLIFVALTHHVTNDENIMDLLALLPQSSGGVTPLVIGVHHPSSIVRRASCQILSRLLRHSAAGLAAVQSLPLFHRLALARLETERHEESQRIRTGSDESQKMYTSQSTGDPPSESTLWRTHGGYSQSASATFATEDSFGSSSSHLPIASSHFLPSGANDMVRGDSSASSAGLVDGLPNNSQRLTAALREMALDDSLG